MLPEIDWNLAWTIACGVVIGGFFLSLLSIIGRMWEDNWRVTILVVICHTIFPSTVLGAFFGYFTWIWLLPSFIVSMSCYNIATNILVK